jgi:hypothetical protein
MPLILSSIPPSRAVPEGSLLMLFVDVIFPVRGDALPTDHAYPLYTALTRVAPGFQDDRVPLSFNRINGRAGAKGHRERDSGLRSRPCPDESGANRRGREVVVLMTARRYSQLSSKTAPFRR